MATCIGLLVVFFSFLSSVELISVTVPQRFVNITKGETANLQCTFTTNQPTTNLIVEWTLYKESSMTSEQVYYSQAGIEVIGKQFKGRLTMLTSPSMTKNASILISDMQSSDAGTYSCDVHNVPDVESNSQGIVTVNVFEKPSAPFCAVHGDVETGHLVTLTCHTERGSPAPTYTWTKLNQGKGRSVRGMTDVKSGIMYIRNISQFEFGEYQCNASNTAGFATCTVELTEELSHGAVVGAVIGALLGVCFIALLVWFIMHRLKKQRYQTAKATEMQGEPQGGAAIRYEGVPTRASGSQATPREAQGHSEEEV